MKKLVVIGAGMASGRLLEQLFEAAPGEWHVTLFNAEPRGNYNRLMLSPVLSGEKTYEQIVTHDADWYAAHGVDCRFGEPVVRIDRANRAVYSNAGGAPYDALVIATGSAPFIIPVPGRDLPGVVTYRDLEDTNAMIEAGVAGKDAVVIGGGLLGLEAAAGMAARGARVTVVHLMGHLMERQLDPAAGYLLQRDLERRGIKVHCKGATKAILGHGQAEAVLLEDGTVHPADLVCMAVGIRPEVRLANDAHLEVERGIVVDDALRTSDPHIFALGECVEHRGQVFGLVAPLYDQAKVLARTLLGEEAAFRPVQTATKLKVTGCDLFSAGDFAEGEGREDIVFRDPGRGIYKRLVLENDRIVGVVMYGDTADGNWFYGLMKDETDVGEMRDTLIFGPAFQGGAKLDPMAAVAALPPEAEICGCNGVCKGAITDAVLNGATTLEAVRACTKASGSCGTCTGLVEQVMKLTLGDGFVAPAPAGMCKCTDHSHEDVRRLIRSMGLKSIPAVMQELGWKTVGGCHSCRPALNYYLLAEYPLDYRDDRQSRFVNERNHANIQKDGTYSVVPRMWGGVTTPSELRAIADAAEKYAVPMVKVTGGQRIDLLGVKKEDLPHMWADLNAAGLVSGHAYSKGLRTVKTCVGSEFCRFGTQDSTGLGIRLEKLLWGSWTPHKVKLGVSGCPRNCAEATCKDVGVVCVDSGYQISVAGAAGMEVKETEPLATTPSEDEAVEIITAFVQLYREHARYLDRPYKWVAKVGLDWVREQIEDVPTRRALVERFEISQSVYRRDPWAEHSTTTETPKWAPLADLTLEAAE
ncbi:nitrite reductase large subunit NirB [Paracoccus denitrificans]|jgi:nitrite reductase (NADH) large subunit|uniref:Assimilatory nitrite reductase (NAD(P)H) large subunit n=1 Tax=Paracoccus denitrificans (strain Pd 1222) TaxID=318586 RepID=A1BAH2_PARDP|nr:nitrite reductase large subunit NirB [Paracoccus denitrificans]ABL72516.1 assimilatory nitrite reductase (NAD(P)H) large subunit precursor [Paracoccus denitrificans PD1222]MBB4626508.1 nitrite reductase (NADH) large subunit [Paracoccus denitrificans]MCU7428850.1 nitrite reductase large subunit NirB [Paracoccus denitrificans]QAR29060.1 NAD(P)/FAD-dependent oxidoreductase [Paracoccus denitrificans]UPV97222.1 nitrite reductase large subunit NirB [Paracoccus denitrificans]